jgi:small subunit ribosomal protein S2
MPYINERWLGGMLTNFETISKRVGKMTEYERMQASGEFEAMPKKEALLLSRELEKLQRNLGGIRKMAKLPDAVFILDTKKEHIAVTEARKLKIPVIATVDTNCDPDVIDYPIPANDDAIRSGSLMCRIVADAVEEGRYIHSRRNPGAATPTIVRSVEEEDRIAAQQTEARRQAAAAQAERDARVASGAPPAPSGDESAPAESAPAESAPAEVEAEAPPAPAEHAELAAETPVEAPASEPVASESVASDESAPTDTTETTES